MKIRKLFLVLLIFPVVMMQGMSSGITIHVDESVANYPDCKEIFLSDLAKYSYSCSQACMLIVAEDPFYLPYFFKVEGTISSPVEEKIMRYMCKTHCQACKNISHKILTILNSDK